jgi:uncharacterized protein
MDHQEIISKTENYAREILSGETTGHDWWHTCRVWRTAVSIGEKEGADLFVVQLAALLHDIADWKFHNGDESAGARQAAAWLDKLGLDEETISHVSDIIRNISFKGAGVNSSMRTLEGRVVQDADRLDALGAIGIARAFAYGGSKGREIYNPDIKTEKHDTFEAYKSSRGPTLNHFYEKLLLLKDLMNTKTGKKIAEERHGYMEQFLKRFIQEWKGRDI